MKPKTSVVWNYFNEVNANTAKCKLCEKTYSRKGGTTTSLKGHLKSMHVTEYEECIKLENEKRTQYTPRLQLLFKKPENKLLSKTL